MRGRKGIATLLVLWAMLLLGTLAMSFSLSMRTEAQAARNGLDAARAYYQARSGLSRAIALLSSLPPDNVLSMSIAGEEGDAGYEVRIRPEGGMIDVNAVPEAMLKAVLKKGGLDDGEADRVGDAILDWRDADDIPRANGAEEAAYAALPEPVRPRNGRLATVDELQYVKGVTPSFHADFLSKVFTASGSGLAVNVNSAPLEVLQAMPGISPGLARAIVERRREAPFATPAALSQFLAGEGVAQSDIFAFSTFNVSHAYTVVSTGRAGEAARRTASCLLEIGGSAQNPVRMSGWKDQVFEDEE